MAASETGSPDDRRARRRAGAHDLAADEPARHRRDRRRSRRPAGRCARRSERRGLRRARGRPGLGGQRPDRCMQGCGGLHQHERELSAAINPTTFCAGMGTTLCSGGSGQAAPSASVDSFTVSVHYPVPDAEIADGNLIGGKRPNDGTQCQRMRVVIRSSNRSLFGGILGTSTLSAVRSATARPWPIGEQRTPALWLLDPRGCTSLAVSGGSQLTVGTSTVQGVLTIDSDGSTCQLGHTRSARKAAAPCSRPSRRAAPTRASSSCSACHRPRRRASPPAPGRPRATRPTSAAAGSRPSRFRCRRRRRGLASTTCSTVATRIRLRPRLPRHLAGRELQSARDPPYIDNLKAAVGTSGLPTVAPAGIGTTYQRWRCVVQLQPARHRHRVGELVGRLPGGLRSATAPTSNSRGGNVSSTTASA